MSSALNCESPTGSGVVTISGGRRRGHADSLETKKDAVGGRMAKILATKVLKFRRQITADRDFFMAKIEISA